MQITSSKGKNKTYTQQFEEEIVALVTEHGHAVIEAFGARPNHIYNWKQRIVDEASGTRLTGEDREELPRLRRGVKILRVEKEIFKKASAYFVKEMK